MTTSPVTGLFGSDFLNTAAWIIVTDDDSGLYKREAGITLVNLGAATK
jgi:hypothetical protein